MLSFLLFFFSSLDDLIGRVAFDRETLAQSPKGLDKWFPVSLVDMYNYSDIQGDIRIEITVYEKVKKSLHLEFHLVRGQRLRVDFGVGGEEGGGGRAGREEDYRRGADKDLTTFPRGLTKDNVPL